LIALAHVALVVGLIRWSVAARASTNAESIVWLGEDLAPGKSENEKALSVQRDAHPIQPKPLKDDESEEEKPAVTTAKSEIELPSPTPKPTPTSKSTPKPKVTPKTTPRPAPKKILLAKASPKPVPKTKPSPAKAGERSEKNQKSLTAKTGTASQNRSGKIGSTAKGSSASGLPAVASAKAGGSSASEFGWYGHMLHDRFYSAWIQPTTSVPSGSKISTLVKVRIEKDGRVSKFEIIKPSENVVVNESVAAIAKRVTEVDAPPAGLIKGDYYNVKINFELNTEQEMAK
jgi:outer membrane biosynthesis protein TonB